ncbi:MAG: hypothetical protein MUE52_17380 [Tabrizicola sp.]|nr:hypothetical protein [Tabrizicola sp.]
MLSALYAGIRPHPPEATPLFGMAPFIGASVSLALAAAIVGPGTTAIGRVLSLLAAVSALVSFGPQKYLDPKIGQIWPAVIIGQLAALSIILLALRATGSRVPSGATTVTLDAR